MFITNKNEQRHVADIEKNLLRKLRAIAPIFLLVLASCEAHLTTTPVATIAHANAPTETVRPTPSRTPSRILRPSEGVSRLCHPTHNWQVGNTSLWVDDCGGVDRRTLTPEP